MTTQSSINPNKHFITSVVEKRTPIRCKKIKEIGKVYISNSYEATFNLPKFWEKDSIQLHAIFMDGIIPLSTAMLSKQEDYEINFNYQSLLSIAIANGGNGVILASNKWIGVSPCPQILEIIEEAKTKLNLVGVTLHDYLVLSPHGNYFSCHDDMIGLNEKGLFDYETH